MIGFRILVLEALVVCSPYYKKEEEELPRRLSRLTKTAEHIVFGLAKGTQNYGKGVVNADSSRLQSACVDLKMMTWICCVCFMGMLRCDVLHSIEAVLSPSSPD